MFKDYTKYEVYPNGKIWSYSQKKWLKPFTNKKDGYQRVSLVDNEGKRKTFLVHRVIFEAVTRSPIPKGFEINHISEAKDENFFANLQLLSHKDNLNYGSRNARASKTKTNGVRSKQVGAFRNNELVMKFPSTAECGRQGFNQGNVAACCRGELKTYKGFEWRYI